MPRLRNAAACERAVNHAVKWLKTRYGDDEEWSNHSQPLLTYHKLPYLFAITGNQEQCRRALTWIKANLFTDRGDFLAAPAEEGKPPARAAVREKAWVALAAQITGRFDISLPAARFLASRQGGATGGVYEAGAQGLADAADVRSTACAGFVFLHGGLLSEARGAGRFLVRAMELQVEEDRFYLRLDGQGRQVTSFPRAQADSRVVIKTHRRPFLSYLGTPAVFLTKFHLATGEEEWLEAAMDYWGFAERCGADGLASDDSAFLAWGAACLYSITRRRIYYDSAERVAQAWIERQKSDGTWRAHGATRDVAATLALTAQTGLCLAEALREAQ